MSLVTSAAWAGEPATVVDVWPDKVPGETGPAGPDKSEQKAHGEKPITLLTQVTKPTLSVYRPAKDKETGAAVVISSSV